MDANKRVYHDSFQTLRDTKSEIERIQRVFEAGKLRMHADFESWYVNKQQAVRCRFVGQYCKLALRTRRLTNSLLRSQTLPPVGGALPRRDAPLPEPIRSSMAPLPAVPLAPMITPVQARPPVPLTGNRYVWRCCRYATCAFERNTILGCAAALQTQIFSHFIKQGKQCCAVVRNELLLFLHVYGIG